MKAKTKRLVDFFATPLIEEVSHQVVSQAKEGAAGRICCSVFTIGTGDTLEVGGSNDRYK